MNARMRGQFREQLLLWFRDDGARFRRFVGDLPGSDSWLSWLPGPNAPVAEVVEKALELINRDGRWDSLAPTFFLTLIRYLEGRREHIERWQRYLAGRNQPPGRGRGFSLILLHHGEASPAAVAREIQQLLGWQPVALERVFHPPVVLAQDLVEERALWLGRRLELAGAVVSYRSPPEVRPLPRVRRSSSGCLLARIPPVDEGPPAEDQPAPFWLMRYPVTEAFLAEVMGDGHGPARPGFPAAGLSRQDALAFCEVLSEREGMKDDPYRLPSEAEWVFAARASGATRFPGSDVWRDVAFAVDGRQTWPVGRCLANRWGLHDMAGNVWEWTSDLLMDGTGAPAQGVLKGGCYDSPESDLLPASRKLWPPGERHPAHGLRLARSITRLEEDSDTEGGAYDPE